MSSINLSTITSPYIVAHWSIDLRKSFCRADVRKALTYGRQNEKKNFVLSEECNFYSAKYILCHAPILLSIRDFRNARQVERVWVLSRLPLA